MNNQAFTISIIVPAYNEEKTIGKCLKSFQRYLPKKSNHLIEIIVVDNASTDNTAEICKNFPNVKVIYEPSKGSNRARQRGLEEAKGELLAFIDADSMITKKWFNTVEKRFSYNEKLVCLSGPYKLYDLPKWQQHIAGLAYVTLYKPVFYLTRAAVFGGNMVIKREALEKIGGFNIDINLFGDDMDLARRIRKVGKTSFELRFKVLSSGRKLKHSGILKTFFISYVANYFWVMILHRPLTKNNKDIRD